MPSPPCIVTHLQGQWRVLPAWYHPRLSREFKASPTSRRGFGKAAAAKGTDGLQGGSTADAQTQRRSGRAQPALELPLHPHTCNSLNVGKTQTSVLPAPPQQHEGTRWRQPEAQRRSPLHGKLPQPKNRLALTKAAVILLSARFPRNCSEKGASAEPGNPSSWGKTTTFLQKGYSSVHLDCAGSYLNPELIIFNLLISYLLLFHFFTLNK